MPMNFESKTIATKPSQDFILWKTRRAQQRSQLLWISWPNVSWPWRHCLALCALRLVIWLHQAAKAIELFNCCWRCVAVDDWALPSRAHSYQSSAVLGQLTEPSKWQVPYGFYNRTWMHERNGWKSRIWLGPSHLLQPGCLDNFKSWNHWLNFDSIQSVRQSVLVYAESQAMSSSWSDLLGPVDILLCHESRTVAQCLCMNVFLYVGGSWI